MSATVLITGPVERTDEKKRDVSNALRSVPYEIRRKLLRDMLSELACKQLTVRKEHYSKKGHRVDNYTDAKWRGGSFNVGVPILWLWEGNLCLIGYCVLRYVPYWLDFRLTSGLPVTDWRASRVADYSPPAKANRAQSPAESLPDVRIWESCRVMQLVGGLSRGFPVPSLLAFRRFSILISITLIGSQDSGLRYASFFPAAEDEVAVVGVERRELPPRDLLRRNTAASSLLYTISARCRNR
ncbi:hypothetical protein PR048_025845 [Dryococelus australis]|uniref:Uncharacterized protein n=1 Tax=Dryococelus australis TaxID=614101 RepID=A0ABQ9GJQ9_9NEOP|nr:hypothetical protein PR048_025845 [Dryococelus australis]